jgi:hypothetical protein
MKCLEGSNGVNRDDDVVEVAGNICSFISDESETQLTS